MRALTLTQPYASLIAAGAKRYETRSWATSYRGPLAIHAARTYAGVGGKRVFAWLATEGDMARIMAEHDVSRWPVLGAFVAVAELTDCIPTMKAITYDDVTLDEIHVGDFTPGRYAFRLENIRALERPIKARGKQGIWHPTDAAIEALEAATRGGRP